MRIPKVQVKLVHDDTLSMFMNMDGTFYISKKCIDICSGDPKLLTLMLCHELSHFLLEHQCLRIINSIIHIDLYKRLFKLPSDRGSGTNDPIKKEF